MSLMPVAEALQRVLADAKALPEETVPLADALGRVLTADVSALRTQPPGRRFGHGRLCRSRERRRSFAGYT